MNMAFCCSPGSIVACYAAFSGGGPAARAALAQPVQVLGDTHPDTLTSRNNLTYDYRAVQAVQQSSTAISATEGDCSPPQAAD